MFRRMALFVLVAGFITALLPRQSRSYQIQTCTWVVGRDPTTITNYTANGHKVSFSTT